MCHYTINVAPQKKLFLTCHIQLSNKIRLSPYLSFYLSFIFIFQSIKNSAKAVYQQMLMFFPLFRMVPFVSWDKVFYIFIIHNTSHHCVTFNLNISNSFRVMPAYGNKEIDRQNFLNKFCQVLSYCKSKKVIYSRCQIN